MGIKFSVENDPTSVTDAERSGRPATATTTRNEERTLELIGENRIITVEEFAGRLNVSVGSACSLIHDSLKFSKVCARWVPKELTEERKRKHLDVCSRHLARYREDGDNFLHQIVTGDETWIHHYEPESKRQTMQWSVHIYLSVLLWNHLYSFTVRTVIITYPWYLNHLKL